MEKIAVIASLLNVVGFISYFKELKKEKTSTSSVAWLLSAIIATCATVTQFNVSGFYFSLSYLLGALCCWSIFVISSLKNRKLNIENRIIAEYGLKILFAVALAVCSLIVPKWSIICLVVYYCLSYSVLIEAVKKGSNEPLVPWIWWIACALLHCLSIYTSNLSISAYVLPVTNLMCWTLTGTVIISERIRRN